MNSFAVLSLSMDQNRIDQLRDAFLLPGGDILGVVLNNILNPKPHTYCDISGTPLCSVCGREDSDPVHVNTMDDVVRGAKLV